MVDLIITAIPAFVLLLVVEALSFHLAGHDDHDHGHAGHDHAGHDDHAHPGHDHAGDGDLIGFERADTRTSLIMGVGNVVVNLGWKAVVLAVYAALYELSPVHLDAGNWWTWVLLFFADDLAYYWYHRAGHRVRILWASHVVHHSSEHYNLSTALRQTWTPMGGIVFWAWMPLVGFAPWMIFLAMSWNLLYQFWIHTERITKLPRWFEFVFNTPSHHRVHHGSQEQYLDRNYAGILILWDRLLGTFEPERERVCYGLTTNIKTFNPVRVAFHEYVAIWKDMRRTPQAARPPRLPARPPGLGAGARTRCCEAVRRVPQHASAPRPFRSGIETRRRAEPAARPRRGRAARTRTAQRWAPGRPFFAVGCGYSTVTACSTSRRAARRAGSAAAITPATTATARIAVSIPVGTAKPKPSSPNSTVTNLRSRVQTRCRSSRRRPRSARSPSGPCAGPGAWSCRRRVAGRSHACARRRRAQAC